MNDCPDCKRAMSKHQRSEPIYEQDGLSRRILVKSHNVPGGLPKLNQFPSQAIIDAAKSSAAIDRYANAFWGVDWAENSDVTVVVTGYTVQN